MSRPTDQALSDLTPAVLSAPVVAQHLLHRGRVPVRPDTPIVSTSPPHPFGQSRPSGHERVLLCGPLVAVKVREALPSPIAAKISHRHRWPKSSALSLWVFAFGCRRARKSISLEYTLPMPEMASWSSSLGLMPAPLPLRIWRR